MSGMIRRPARGMALNKSEAPSGSYAVTVITSKGVCGKQAHSNIDGGQSRVQQSRRPQAGKAVAVLQSRPPQRTYWHVKPFWDGWRG